MFVTNFSFVKLFKGTLPKEEQTEYWYLLIDSFHYSLKPNTNTNITFGCGNLSNVVSMENFLVLNQICTFFRYYFMLLWFF